MSEIVRTTEVRTDTRELTVSTVKLAAHRYGTVVFDDSENGRHSGKSVGGFVIDVTSEAASTRSQALDAHRALALAARDNEIK